MHQILNSSYRYRIDNSGIGTRYAAQLLQDLGASVQIAEINKEDAPQNRWRASGLENLTGYPKQALSQCPIPLAEYADGVLQAIRILSGQRVMPDYQGADLLSIRASITGDTRRGDTSLGESCRFLPTKDGIIAVNLPRPSDWELLDAWFRTEVAANWASVEQHVAKRPKVQLLDQGRLLGLAVADAESDPLDEHFWYKLVQRGTPASKKKRTPRVIDLSSLWAGPLCGQLLRSAGAEVIKVESSQRSDGARFGSEAFYRFLNEGKREVVLDLEKEHGRRELLDLIRSADMVIEASRPRALRQMGIIAEELIEEVPGLSWLAISGYGRSEPEAHWIAYGDDAAVAGGLSAAIYKETGQWMFCGDAIADPLTGLHAALAGLASWCAGGGHLLSLSLVETVQHCVQTELGSDA